MVEITNKPQGEKGQGWRVGQVRSVLPFRQLSHFAAPTSGTQSHRRDPGLHRFQPRFSFLLLPTALASSNCYDIKSDPFAVILRVSEAVGNSHFVSLKTTAAEVHPLCCPRQAISQLPLWPSLYWSQNRSDHC